MEKGTKSYYNIHYHLLNTYPVQMSVLTPFTESSKFPKGNTILIPTGKEAETEKAISKWQVSDLGLSV